MIFKKIKTIFEQLKFFKNEETAKTEVEINNKSINIPKIKQLKK
jgi:hypothetical protein